MLACGNSLGQYQYTMNQYNSDSVVRDVPILIDLSFDKDDEVAINNAIAQWNYALNGWEHLHVVGHIFVDDAEVRKPHDGWLFIKGLSTDKIVLDAEKDDKNYDILGFANYLAGSQLVVIRERILKEDVFGVVLHEIGHLL